MLENEPNGKWYGDVICKVPNMIDFSNILVYNEFDMSSNLTACMAIFFVLT